MPWGVFPPVREVQIPDCVMAGTPGVWKTEKGTVLLPSEARESFVQGVGVGRG